jgi:hypothetical protein
MKKIKSIMVAIKGKSSSKIEQKKDSKSKEESQVKSKIIEI